MFCAHMPPTAIIPFSNVRAKWALVQDSTSHMATDMRIEMGRKVSFERAMGTLIAALIEHMFFQITFVSGAVPTSVTRETSTNS